VAHLFFDRKYITSRHLLRTKKQGGQVATSLGVARASLPHRFALFDAGNRQRSARNRTGSARNWTKSCSFVRAMRTFAATWYDPPCQADAVWHSGSAPWPKRRSRSQAARQRALAEVAI
jgi:hypothetical protein